MRKYFSAPAFWLLAAVSLVELAAGQQAAAAALALLAGLHLLRGWIQDVQARRELDRLRPFFDGTARACRDGIWQPIPANQLVPGDRIQLRAGDRVPAGVLVLEGKLQIQSAAPGGGPPSTAVSGSSIQAGEMILQGEATAQVTATGPEVRQASAAAIPWDAPAGSLRPAVRRFDRKLLLAGGLVAVLVVALASAVGLPALNSLPAAGMVLAAAALAASGDMLAAALARGAGLVSKSGGLPRRLSVLEDLAGLELMILEKAGLLTEDSLSIVQIQAFAPFSENDVLHLAAMASDEAATNPEDRVILAKARSSLRVHQEKKRTAFIPHDPVRQVSEAVYEEDGQLLRVLKGAPAAVLGLAAGTQAGDLYGPIHTLSARGCRVIVVALGAAAGLQVAGLLALEDPPRTDSRRLIQQLKELGIKVVMATSDSRQTAQAVAWQMGLSGQLYPGQVLGETPDEKIGECDVIAELVSDQKAGLVEAYQRLGLVVGITGRALTDVRALKQAQVGVALAPAASMVSEAAGLVLVRPGLSRLVEAVRASRQVMQALRVALEVPAARAILLAGFLCLGVMLAGAIPITPLGLAVWLAVGQVEALLLVRERSFQAPRSGSGFPHPQGRPHLARWQPPHLGLAALGLAVPFLAVSLVVLGAGRVLLDFSPASLQTLALVQLFLAAQGILFAARAGQGSRGPLLAWSAFSLLAVLGLAALGLGLSPLPPAVLLGLVAVNVAVTLILMKQ